MRAFSKTTLAALGVAGIFAASSASAELIDFTDDDTWGPETSASYGLTGTVTVSGTNTISFTNYDGPNPSPTGSGVPSEMDFELDGLGIIDSIGSSDEVTGFTEKLTVAFDNAVTVTEVYFLDLYYDPNPGESQGNGIETIQVDYYLGNTLQGSAVFTAADANPPSADGGWLTGLMPANAVADELRFFMAANSGLDDGNADAAVAGMTVVPIPAAAWLFGSALAGMAGIGYRRSRKA